MEKFIVLNAEKSVYRRESGRDTVSCPKLVKRSAMHAAGN